MNDIPKKTIRGFLLLQGRIACGKSGSLGSKNKRDIKPLR